MEQAPLLKMSDIHKHFGSVKANNGIDLMVDHAEIHAILGENGSGKSTLMNILSGIYMPDRGRIFMEGHEVDISSPRDAQNLGIGMVHQHFKLIEVLSAKENIIGGTKGQLFLRNRTLDKEIESLNATYGFDIDPNEKVFRMPVSRKQSVEILKTLYRGARLLILDEPTAVLTPQEIDRLFSVLKSMRSKGCSIIFITHKLNEVMEISDRVTVLRKGESINTIKTTDTTPHELAKMMVGSAVDMEIRRFKVDSDKHRPIVCVDNVTVRDDTKVTMLKDLSLCINSHEILGVAGVAGSGQRELCEVLSGMHSVREGKVTVKGVDITGLTPREIQACGVTVSFVPEDRLGMGLVAGMSITDNTILKCYCDCRGPFLDKRICRKQAASLLAQYDVSAKDPNQVVRQLSGGNIQKILLGREIERGPDLLIVAYPVRGLDIGASAFVYERLNDQKEKGVAILMIGEDLDVLLGLCDRIAVLHNGELMGIVDPSETSKEAIGLLMMGHREGALQDVQNC